MARTAHSRPHQLLKLLGWSCVVALLLVSLVQSTHIHRGSLRLVGVNAYAHSPDSFCVFCSGSLSAIPQPADALANSLPLIGLQDRAQYLTVISQLAIVGDTIRPPPVV